MEIFSDLGLVFSEILILSSQPPRKLPRIMWCLLGSPILGQKVWLAVTPWAWGHQQIMGLSNKGQCRLIFIFVSSLPPSGGGGRRLLKQFFLSMNNYLIFFKVQKLRFLYLTISEPKSPLKTKLYIQKYAFAKVSNQCVRGQRMWIGDGRKEKRTWILISDHLDTYCGQKYHFLTQF